MERLPTEWICMSSIYTDGDDGQPIPLSQIAAEYGEDVACRVAPHAQRYDASGQAYWMRDELEALLVGLDLDDLDDGGHA
jgi:hypothetical protein